MKKVPPESLFGLFEVTDDDSSLTEETPSFIEGDFFLFGSVVKGIEQYNLLDEIYSNKYGEVYEMFAENIKYRYYSRLHSKLESLRLDDLVSFEEQLNLLGIPDSLNSLNILLEFFIEVEEYEKCSDIVKLINVINNFSK